MIRFKKLKFQERFPSTKNIWDHGKDWRDCDGKRFLLVKWIRLSDKNYMKCNILGFHDQEICQICQI